MARTTATASNHSTVTRRARTSASVSSPVTTVSGAIEVSPRVLMALLSRREVPAATVHDRAGELRLDFHGAPGSVPRRIRRGVSDDPAPSQVLENPLVRRVEGRRIFREIGFAAGGAREALQHTAIDRRSKANPEHHRVELMSVLENVRQRVGAPG